MSEGPLSWSQAVEQDGVDICNCEVNVTIVETFLVLFVRIAKKCSKVTRHLNVHNVIQMNW